METTVTKRRLGIAGFRKQETSLSFIPRPSVLTCLSFLPHLLQQYPEEGPGRVRAGQTTTAVSEVLKTEQLAAVLRLH